MAAATESNSYEEARRQRVKENLKHLEQLGVLQISKGLLEVAQREYKIQKSPIAVRSKKKIELSELRRSSRPKNLAPSYQEEVGDIEREYYRRRGSSRSTNKNADRAYTGRVASYQQIANAIKRAEKLQSDLKSHYPSFVKPMVRSHVSSCFWLGLPSGFCKQNLPLCELKMILEDEDGMEYPAIYIGKRAGLSGGWRGFAMDHNLEDGDALVFELSEQERFKVYIVKAIQEEPNETNAIEDIDGTPVQDDYRSAADTTESPVKKKGRLASGKRPPKTSGKQPAKSGTVKQAAKATKRKHT